MAKHKLKPRSGVLIPQEYPNEISALDATSLQEFYALRIRLYAGSGVSRAIAEQRTPLFRTEEDAAAAAVQSLTLGWGVTAVIVEYGVIY